MCVWDGPQGSLRLAPPGGPAGLRRALPVGALQAGAGCRQAQCALPGGRAWFPRTGGAQDTRRTDVTAAGAFICLRTQLQRTPRFSGAGCFSRSYRRWSSLGEQLAAPRLKEHLLKVTKRCSEQLCSQRGRCGSSQKPFARLPALPQDPCSNGRLNCFGSSHTHSAHAKPHGGKSSTRNLSTPRRALWLVGRLHI